MSIEKNVFCFDEDSLAIFLISLFRDEYFDNPRVFTKAIRSTLIALGYDEDYINGEFRSRMEKFFDDLVGFEDNDL